MTISPVRPPSIRDRDGARTVPSSFSLRPRMNGIAEAPGKVWFWELAAAVIDAGRCVQCGACVAACPTDSIGVDKDDLPHLVKMCTGCSLCWDFCPRGGLRYESTWLKEPRALDDETPPALAPRVAEEAVAPAVVDATAVPAPPGHAARDEDWRITGADPAPGLGAVLGRFAARVRRPSELEAVGAQDGGVVSAVLLACLGAGRIDGAVVAREDPANPWKAIATLATTSGEIRASAGSLYNQTMALASLDIEAAGLDQDARIAVVGTPCEIQGIRALGGAPMESRQLASRRRRANDRSFVHQELRLPKADVERAPGRSGAGPRQAGEAGRDRRTAACFGPGRRDDAGRADKGFSRSCAQRLRRVCGFPRTGCRSRHREHRERARLLECPRPHRCRDERLRARRPGARDQRDRAPRGARAPGPARQEARST